MSHFSPTRRSFLRRALLTAAAMPSLLRSSAMRGQTTSTSAPIEDIATRQVFDRLDLNWNHGDANADQNNDAGALAWGEAYALASYLLMYEAHRDRYYLDKLIDHAEQVLKNRDTIRGVKDYRGLTLPAWSTAGRYTCGAIELKDAKGRAVLLVRSAIRPASQVSIAVAAGSKPGIFHLECMRRAPSKAAIIDRFTDLTMDSAASLINGEFEQRNRSAKRADGGGAMITAKDLRAAGSGADAFPAPIAPLELTPQRYHYAVQTAMIIQPLSGLARLVREDPDLATDRHYAAKAEEYLHAAQTAADLFDQEWRENPHSGEGWLTWARSSPSPFDGVEQPHNQYLALGSVYIDLSALASNDAARNRYRDRATKMARTFKNDLTHTQAADAYAWHYFWTKGKGYTGWSAADDVSDYQPTCIQAGYQRPEDVSHAHIDIDFVLRAFDAQLGVFDEQDMQRFARTLTRQILTRDQVEGHLTTFEFVDGTGRQGMHENMVAAWAPLQRVDATVATLLRSLYRSHALSGNPQGKLFASARMNRLIQRAKIP